MQGGHKTAISPPPVPEMTYNVFSGTLNPTHFTSLQHYPHSMANFGSLAADIGSVVWDTPANFNGFHVLASLLQRRRSPEAIQTLHDVWPSPGLVVWYIIYRLPGAPAP